jgi:hypothetical protein
MNSHESKQLTAGSQQCVHILLLTSGILAVPTQELKAIGELLVSWKIFSAHFEAEKCALSDFSAHFGRLLIGPLHGISKAGRMLIITWRK